MRMHLQFLFVCAVAAGCNNTDELEKRIKALEAKVDTSNVSTLTARVVELEAAKANLEARVAELEAAKAQAETDLGTLRLEHEQLVTATAGVDDLLAVVKVEDGDVVVEGANLRVQSGAGSTAAAPNGKGNLIIGYDERRGVCVAGASTGNPCVDDSTECTCSFDNTPPKTGSHNLILGEGHSYASYSAIVSGMYSKSNGAGASVLGGFMNSATGRLSVIVAGDENESRSGGHGTAILGGWRNVANHLDAVILGGSSNTTTTMSSEIVPRYQPAP